jgi:DNA-binding Lrp family transcriptional regulator
MTILSSLIDAKTLKILKTFLNNPKSLFHLNNLAESASVSVSSTSRIVAKLVKNKIIEEIKIGKLSVYKIIENKEIKKIKRLL